MTEGSSPPSVIGVARASKMIGVVASIIDGVLVGAVYGLAAMGLTLIWGVMNVINLTHGAMIVLGMFALYFLARLSACRLTARCPSPS
jgi:branched-subunit amino acid ABC-type transport system permease component